MAAARPEPDLGVRLAVLATGPAELAGRDRHHGRRRRAARAARRPAAARPAGHRRGTARRRRRRRRDGDRPPGPAQHGGRPRRPVRTRAGRPDGGPGPDRLRTGRQESCLALLTGAALVFGEDIDLREPAAWADLLVRERITVWNSTPTLLDLLLTELERRGDRLPESLRLVLLSGEPLTGALLGRLRRRSGPTRRRQPLRRRGARALGRLLRGDRRGNGHGLGPDRGPMRNQRVHVLAENGGICPVWVTGQVHYGGLAAESARHQSATGTDRWATHPESGEHLLRTPWFGRVLPSGTVETVGHASARLLVHGRRLHVHDTEAALAATDGCGPPRWSRWTTRARSGSSGSRPAPAAPGRNSSTSCAARCLRTCCPAGSRSWTRSPHPDGRVDRGRLAATGGTAPNPSPTADRWRRTPAGCWQPPPRSPVGRSGWRRSTRRRIWSTWAPPRSNWSGWPP
ncbi:AMP-binding protein [Streptomyces sp. M19]